MIEIKVILSYGDFFTTKFNDNLETARKYYIGQTFNTGNTIDNLVKAVDVEIIKTED